MRSVVVLLLLSGVAAADDKITPTMTQLGYSARICVAQQRRESSASELQMRKEYRVNAMDARDMRSDDDLRIEIKMFDGQAARARKALADRHEQVLSCRDYAVHTLTTCFHETPRAACRTDELANILAAASQ